MTFSSSFTVVSRVYSKLYLQVKEIYKESVILNCLKGFSCKILLNDVGNYPVREFSNMFSTILFRNAMPLFMDSSFVLY